MATVCALPECGRPIDYARGFFTIFGSKAEYCSRQCVDVAYTATHGKTSKRRKEAGVPHVPAEDFGAAGVIRRYCDRCRKPITLCWKGRGKEFCTNACRKAYESGDTMPETNTETVTETPSPIVAGAPAAAKPKKTAKPTAKKAAAKPPAKAKPTPKAAKPAKSSNGARDPNGPSEKAEASLEALKKGNVSIAKLMKDNEWSEGTTRTQVARLKRKYNLTLTTTTKGDQQFFTFAK